MRKTWVRDPKVFIDLMVAYSLKDLHCRRYLRKDAAAVGSSLQTQGWKPLKQPELGR